MPLLILILILLVPYLEFLVFMEVGEAIGGFNAFLATILTAVLGVYLIRLQGFEVMQRMHRNLQNGESPIEEIFHGFFLLIAGLFFLLPGFITDSIAVLLAITPVRNFLGRAIVKNIEVHYYGHGRGPRAGPGAGQGPVIDGEYRQEDESPSQLEDDRDNPDHKA